MVTLLIAFLGTAAGLVAAWYAYVTARSAKVEGPQEAFRAIRAFARERAVDLTRERIGTMPETRTIGKGGVLTIDEWVPPRPLPSSGIAMNWGASSPAPLPQVTQRAKELLPPAKARRRLDRYSQAVRALDPPKDPANFEDRASYRILELTLASRPSMTAVRGTFFEGVDISEALAHEAAAAHADLETADAGLPRDVTRGRHPLRKAIGDPFDLSRRHCLASVSCLTLRHHGAGAEFFLHLRDTDVAFAGGMTHVVPTGIFQPAADLPGALERDYDLWLNTVREYAEELLGVDEASGRNAALLDYDEDEPYARITRAVRDGDAKFLVLGAGLHPLTWWLEVLGVAVFTRESFAEAFPTMTPNREGEVIGHRRRKDGLEGFPFTEKGIADVLAHPSLSPAARSCLHLAWRHRAHLLPAAAAA